MNMVDKMDDFMIRIYLRLSGAALFVLIFILGCLYHISPNPVILITLSCMVVMEIIGLDKIGFVTSEVIKNEQSTKQDEIKPHNPVLPKDVIKSIAPVNDRPGFIYVMARQDGIIKIGQTNNTMRRRKDHERDYNQEFNLIKRFAVPDKVSFEKLALRMTQQYKYQEKGRQELRRMPDNALYDFLAEFLLICRQGVDA